MSLEKHKAAVNLRIQRWEVHLLEAKRYKRAVKGANTEIIVEYLGTHHGSYSIPALTQILKIPRASVRSVLLGNQTVFKKDSDDCWSLDIEEAKG